MPPLFQLSEFFFLLLLLLSIVVVLVLLILVVGAVLLIAGDIVLVIHFYATFRFELPDFFRARLYYDPTHSV